MTPTSIFVVPGKRLTSHVSAECLRGCGPSSLSWSSSKTAVQNNKRSTTNPLPYVAQCCFRPVAYADQLCHLSLVCPLGLWLICSTLFSFLMAQICRLWGGYTGFPMRLRASDSIDLVLSVSTSLLWFMQWQFWSADGGGYVIHPCSKDNLCLVTRIQHVGLYMLMCWHPTFTREIYAVNRSFNKKSHAGRPASLAS